MILAIVTWIFLKLALVLAQRAARQLTRRMIYLIVPPRLHNDIVRPYSIHQFLVACTSPTTRVFVDDPRLSTFRSSVKIVQARVSNVDDARDGDDLSPPAPSARLLPLGYVANQIQHVSTALQLNLRPAYRTTPALFVFLLP
jgi:hypothetical protein